MKSGKSRRGAAADAANSHQVEPDAAAAARQQAAVAELSQRLLLDLDPQTLFAETAGLVIQALGEAACCQVWQRLPETSALQLRVSAGCPVDVADKASLEQLGQAQAAYALQSAEPVIVEELAGEFPFLASPLAEQVGTTSGFSLAIRGREKTWGVINLFASQPRTFSANLHFLQSVANLLALALDRREVETFSLRDSQVIFQALFEAAPDAKVIVNTEGCIERINTQAETMFQYNRAELLGQPVELLLPEQFRQRHVEHRTTYQHDPLTRPMGIGLELYGQRKDGSSFPVDVMLSPLRLDDTVLIISAIRDKTEQRRVEEKIRERERQLAEAQAIAHVGSWEWDIPSDVVLWSDELYRIYGLPPQELMITYREFLERVHPEDLERVESLVAQAYQEHRPLSFEHRIVQPDGTVRMLQARCKVILDETGQPIKMIGTGLDITERKEIEAQIQQLNAELEQRVVERTAQLKAVNLELKAEILERQRAETALEESRRRLHSLFDNNLDAIILVDDTTRCTDVNRAACALTGYSREELLQMGLLELAAAGQESEALWPAFLAAGEQSGEDRLCCKDGTTVAVEYRAVANVIPGLHMWVLRDITERKRIETALEEQRLFLRQVIDLNPNFIFAKDRQGRFTLVNQAIAEAYGTTVEELIGKTDADFNSNAAEVEHFHRDDLAVIETGQEKFIPEETVTEASGRVRWLQTVKRPITGPDGSIDQLLGVASDITARKQAEQQLEASLRETERLLQEKEVLIKEIHHRVKNNLQAVWNLLYLQAGYVQDQQMKQMFRETQDRIKTIALIHEKLYQAPNLAQLNFAEYIRSLAASLIQSYSIHQEAIKLVIEIDDIAIDVDTAIPLGLIVNELISNSLKYAFPPTLDWPEGTAPEIRIELNVDDAKGRLMLIVCDNGVGLPEDIDIASTNTLGLQLIHMLTQHMNGTVEAGRNDGTIFKIKWQLPEQ